MANTIDISNSYIINNFSSSLGRGDYTTSKQTTSETGAKTVTFTNHFGESNISAGDVLRISDGSTTVDYTIVHPSGEYAVSSSISESTFTTQGITSSVTNGYESGGRFSPDGTKLAVPTYRHGGAGSTDYGIDIYTSSSAGGWAPSGVSIDGTTLPDQVRWFSDNEIFTTQGSYLRNYISGSGGWTAGSVVRATGGDDYLVFNPSKTAIATWKTTDHNPLIFYSSSGNWTAAGGTTSVSSAGNMESFTWAGDNTFISGYPQYTYPAGAFYKGALYAFTSTDNNQTFSQLDYIVGDSVAFPGMGAALYYHTASDSLLVGTRAGTSEGSDVKNKLILLQSSSAEGILPASYTSHTLIDSMSGRRVLRGANTTSQVGNGNRILMTTHDDGGDHDLLSIESGSSGWVVSVVADTGRDPGPEGNIHISARGEIVYKDTARLSGQSNFKVSNMYSGSSGGDASNATDLGGGTDRSALLVVDEIITKVLASALDITAVDNGGTSTNASFKLTPGAGKTLAITEDPSGDGNFGATSGFTTIVNITTTTSTSIAMAPFRFMTPCIMNVRGQTTGKGTQTFLGEQKS